MSQPREEPVAGPTEAGPSNEPSRPVTRGSRPQLVFYDKKDENKVYKIHSAKDLAIWVKDDPKFAYNAILEKLKFWTRDRKKYQKEMATDREELTRAQDETNLALEDLERARKDLEEQDEEAGERIRAADKKAEHLQETLNDLRADEVRLITKLTASEKAVAKNERVIRRLRAERDKLAANLVEANRARTRTSTAAADVPLPTIEGNQKRSPKMPDPLMLSDGKENADWFPTAHYRIHYVSTRCEGRALKHIGPRLHRTSTNRYTNAEDMLEHLAEIFEDPNRKENARQEYEQLKQKPKEEFADFIAEYSRLAEEAEIPVEDRKRGLYRKLVWRLQDRVTQYMIDPSLTLQDFVRRCQDTATQLNINFKDNPPPARGGSGRGGTDKNKTTGTGSPSTSPRPQIDPAERAVLLKNGQCFYCRGKGYMAKDCPEKKTLAVAATGNMSAAAVAASPDPRLVDIESEQPAKE
ncbi:hypothetical protein N7509_008127 [Penicillium cosmopolitanum]|uniref:CCHC-type domain-containing protein n=1 Tax=Penicillium cosmopolitanum TaxID=1131564 RepID=A0A9W9W050_9EURO|nr:uncharacterized protein N7509_008127 [Penicillium cosmopolitanum]KAJ5392637.1 hypothetical protein N7509_008127 [Penicillium cosmopolitanum]